MNDEDHVLLSEKLEDQLKAVEWAHEQKKFLMTKADVSQMHSWKK